MSVTPPALPDLCWPVDWSCNEQFAVDPGNAPTVAIAEALAVQTLRALTAFKVGGCPVTLRPCAMRCSPTTGLMAPVSGSRTGGWAPYIMDGVWFNACRCSSRDTCGCGHIEEITLPGPVGDIIEVLIDSAVLSPTAYRVDNGTQLVRTDGGSWPTCQDMSAPVGAEGTFTVRYLQGAKVDGLGAAAAGALANEFAQALCGGGCALPPGVVSLVQSGTTMAIEPGSFPGGLTGIFVVDAFVRYWNPFLQKAGPDVYSPDLPRGRRQTWGS